MVKQEVRTEVLPEFQLGAADQSTGGSRSRVSRWMLAYTSFLFVLLQSVCAAVMALSGLRLLIGVGSLAVASGVKIFAISFHTGAIRIPMILVAVCGSVLNLYVLRRIRSLRTRPSSQWRVDPVTPAQRRSESLQIALAVITLLLVGLEAGLHLFLHGTV